MKYNRLLLVLIILIITSCSRNSNDKNESRMKHSYTFSEILGKAYLCRDDNCFDSLCNVLGDSIEQSKDILILSTILSINDQQKEVCWSFVEEDFHNIRVNDKFIFDILVKEKGVVLIDNKFEEVNKIKYLFTNFVFGLDSIYNFKAKKSISFSGEVNRPKAITVFTLPIISEKSISTNKWKCFFDSMHQIMSYYNDKRDSVSLEMWGKEYAILNFKEKVAVMEYIRLKIFIFFIPPSAL